mgnify:CR=1 FL=1
MPLDPERYANDFSKIAAEVLGNLSGIDGARLRLTLSIDASAIEGEEFTTLYDAIQSTLREAVARNEGLAASELKGEKKSNDELSQKMAALCDVWVHDAFGTAHRAEATTYGMGKYAKIACAGPCVASELEALTKALAQPARPLVAIVGGSKVSTKLTVLESLSAKVDQLVVGGGIANTFLLASGKKIGKSLAEHDLVDQAQAILAKVKVPLPTDVVVAKEFSATAPATIKAIDDVADDDLILDIGPDSAKALAAIVANAGTVVWNGPVGVFEMEAFANGTRVLADAIATSKAFSLAGGGDTVSAINVFKIHDKVGYISTAGGAFLEFLEGKTLPAVEILAQRAQN